ncbi:MAG TPA: LodA/GoxA family CTQ-dependent oxidase [Acidimicrobiales bacterium]
MLISRRDFLRTSAVAAGIALLPEVAAVGSKPGQAAAATSSMLERAVSFEIHPSVGIARVGNSADAFYFGPEVRGGLPDPSRGFKDGSGAMAKQAARFRIFAYGPGGKVLGEVPRGAKVEWKVSVANKKAAWYESAVAMDLSVSQPVNRRNPGVTSDRQALVGSATSSTSTPGQPTVPLIGGPVFGNTVNFGEIFTDAEGRLVVLPGDGRGYPAPGAAITTFSDNDGWTDNICDGPVEAVLTIGSRRVAAKSAYLVVTPPNYGPALAAGPISLLDEVRSPLTFAGMIPFAPVTFQGDILPLLQRLVDLQWVNKGIFEMTRQGAEMDWLSPRALSRLADPGPRSRPYRTRIARLFRNPAYQSSQVDQQPLFLGDGVTLPPTNQYSWLPLTTLQYLQMQAWAEGRFEPGHPIPPLSSIEQLPLAERPRSLDEASLDSTLGGANHPGVETPWVLRVPSMWESAYHLRIESTAVVARDYGPTLTPAVTMGPAGPVHGVSPGDITMWMGVPWHADAASCASGYRTPGYTPPISPFLPTFWPARVPNEVLAQSDYDVLVDTSRPMSARQAAFTRRRTWIRPLAPIAVVTQRLTEFVQTWPTLGLVTDKPGPADGAFPRRLKVETDVGYEEPPPSSSTTYVCSSRPGVTCPVEW